MTTNFRNVLRHCRRLAGLSQMELALDADVSPRHLSFLESGRAEPGRDVVARLAAALRLAGTARNALFISAGFAPTSDLHDSPPDTRQVMERMILSWDPHPGALAGGNGCVLATNVGMRALHATLTGAVGDLQGLSARELALGQRGLGPYLTNRAALERRFTHCGALEKLMAGAAVDSLPPPADGPAPRRMSFASDLGELAFELVEIEEGRLLRDSMRSLRAYMLTPLDHRTGMALSTMVARYEDRVLPLARRTERLRRAS
jgi:transcriptional regulator with XRE-family HTH domain